jgi:integrase
MSMHKKQTSEGQDMKRPRGTGSVFQQKGSSVYWIKYYRNGQPFRESSGSEKIKDAEKLLRTRIGEVAVHTWVSPADRRVTVDELYSALLDDYRNNGLASLDGARQRWEREAKEGAKPEPGRLKKFFGGMRALMVTTDLLNRYVTECREAGLSNATINRDMSALRRAFNLALRADKIQKVPSFPHLKEAAPRSGFVEEGDYQKLAACSQELWLRALLATAYTFGFRKEELLSLEVSQVDLAARTIRLNPGETKSEEGRTIAMTADVFTLLSACVSGKQQNDFVFTRPDGSRVLDFRGRWDTLITEAGCSGLLFHDLRRSAVRNMVRRGIPEVVAMKISGHKTREVFDRYNIVSESDLKDAALKIEAGQREWAEIGHSSGMKEERGQGEEKPRRLN